MLQRIEFKAAQPAFAIGDHIVGEHGVGEHRDMAEDVVEDVGFLEVIELFGRADKIARGKAPVREVVEEDIVGDEAGHRDDLPPRRRRQARIEFAIIGNARLFEAQHVDAAQKGFGRAAGQHLRLAREEAIPHRMFVGGEGVPILRNRPVGRGARRRRVVDVGKLAFHIFFLARYGFS